MHAPAKHNANSDSGLGVPSGAYPRTTRKRGPKPKHLCPGDLQTRIELHEHLAEVCRHYGVPRKTLHRWMNEAGIAIPLGRKQRPRGVTPRYVRIANTPSGKRVKARLYSLWDSMHKRCYYPKQNRYERYGGRGIQVCAEWHDYDAFRAWAISHGFAKGLSLDRIDTDGHYEPGNCRWIDPKFQQWNSSRTIHLTLNGITRPLPEWATLLGVSRELLRTRRLQGWTHEQILTTPLLTNGQTRPGVLRGRAAHKAHQFSSNPSTSQE